MNRKNLFIALILIIAGAGSRLLPHINNFAPIAGIALLAAAYLPRRLALAVPLSAMVVSDLMIGLHDTVLFTWGSYVLIALLGSLAYSKTARRWHLVAAAPLASVIFFVVSNFGVWLVSGMYSHNMAGFLHCYYMALPFFRSTLGADFLYTPVLFVLAYWITESRSTMRSSSRLQPHQLQPSE